MLGSIVHLYHYSDVFNFCRTLISFSNDLNSNLILILLIGTKNYSGPVTTFILCNGTTTKRNVMIYTLFTHFIATLAFFINFYYSVVIIFEMFAFHTKLVELINFIATSRSLQQLHPFLLQVPCNKEKGDDPFSNAMVLTIPNP